jgi:hypothetical protein
MEPENPTFSTDHIYLCAFLICLGHRIVAARCSGRRVAFHFSCTPRLDADIAGFMAGAAIPARQFSFEILKLKRMIHEGKNTVKRVDDDYSQQDYSGIPLEVRER